MLGKCQAFRYLPWKTQSKLSNVLDTCGDYVVKHSDHFEADDDAKQHSFLSHDSRVVIMKFQQNNFHDDNHRANNEEDQ